MTIDFKKFVLLEISMPSSFLYKYSDIWNFQVYGLPIF